MAEQILTDNPTQKPKLLDQLRHAVRARHYAKSTEKTYVSWAYRFIVFHSPREIEFEFDIFAASSLLEKIKNCITFKLSHGVKKRHPKDMGMRSPADFLGNDFIRPDKPFAALPPALEQKSRETVNNRYNGDLKAAILAFLNLHEAK